MNSDNSPDNMVGMNTAHCQLLTEQIGILESRVIEMEQTLLAQVARLHDSVTDKLDSLFDENTIIQFDGLPENEGTIKLSNPDSNKIATGRSNEVIDTIKATREQLELLNQTIANIQLPR